MTPKKSPEVELIQNWIITHVDERVVPRDEGNSDGLLYNLLHVLWGDERRWNYERDQYEELKALGVDEYQDKTQ